MPGLFRGPAGRPPRLYRVRYAVLGGFDLPPLARLAPEDQTFVLCFLQTGGNLKHMAKLYGVSYPTLRNRLDALVEQLGPLEEAESPKDTLGKVEQE